MQSSFNIHELTKNLKSVMSSKYNLDLHIPHKRKDLNLLILLLRIFFAYEKGGIEFYLCE